MFIIYVGVVCYGMLILFEFDKVVVIVLSLCIVFCYGVEFVSLWK